MAPGLGLRRPPTHRLLLFLLLAAAIAFTAELVYRSQAERLKQKVSAQLTLVAERQAADLMRWRQQYETAAALATEQPLVTGAVQAFLAAPDSAAARSDLEAWLAWLRRHGRFATVRLLDAQGRTLLAVPDGSGATPAYVEANLWRTRQTNQIVWTSLERTAAAGPESALLIPLNKHPASSEAPVAVLCAQVSATESLYPLLGSWSFLGQNGTTTLVRRDGDAVLFLAPMGGRPETALSLRVPITTTSLPEALAVTGTAHAVDGYDYLGRRVLASSRQVPGTDWFLVPQIPVAQLDPPLDRCGLLIALFAACLIALIGTVLLVNSRGQALRDLRRHCQRELARFALQTRQARLLGQSLDGMLILDATERIVELNDRMLALCSLAPAEAPQRLSDLVPESALGAIRQALLQPQAGKDIRLLAALRQAEGSAFPVELSIRPIVAEATPYWHFTVRRELPQAPVQPVQSPELADPATSESLADLAALSACFAQAMGILCWLRGPQLVVMLASPAALQLLGRTDAVGRPLHELVAGSLQQEIASAAKRAQTEAQPQLIQELFVEVDKTGEGPVSEAWYSLVIQPILDDRGDVTDVLIQGLDVSAQVLARREVDDHAALVQNTNAALERRLALTPPPEKEEPAAPQSPAAALWAPLGNDPAQILDLGSTLIALVDAAGAIVRLNWPAERLLGYASAEVAGQSFAKRFLPPAEAEPFRSALAALARQRTMAPLTQTWQTRDGLRREIVWSGVALPQADGPVSHFLITGSDITELRQAERAQRACEAKFRAVLNSLGKAAFLYEIKENGEPGRFLEVSDAGGQRFYHRAELLAMLRPDLQADVAPPMVPEQRQLLEQGHAVYRSTRFDAGVGVPVEVEAHLVHLDEGQAVLAIVRDLPAPLLQVSSTPAEIKADETSRPEELCEAVERTVPFGFWAADARGDVTYLSDSFLQTMGTTLQECRGDGWLRCCPLDQVDQARAAWQARTHSGQPGDCEFRVLDSDRNERWILNRGSPVRDAAGDIVGWVGVNLDVTARRTAAGDRFRTSVASLPYPFLLCTDLRRSTGEVGDLIVDYANAAALASGILPQEGLPCQLSAILISHPELGPLQDYLQTLETGNALTIERTAYGGENSAGQLLRALDVSVMRLDDGLAVTWRDITQRRLAEDELRRAITELERSNKDLEQFAYVASHDLQEPLRTVSSFVQLLSRRYRGRLDADADEFIGYAVEGATRLQHMINGLLEYSRLGTRAQPLAPCDVNLVVHQALVSLQAAIQESGATINVDLLPTVQADEGQLVQVFQNLIGNALKFRRNQPPTISISAQRHPGEWRFAVRDNGIGIEPDARERLFQVFQRLHNRADYPGTGIGLAMCRRIIERHGGRIWVESEPGVGSTFFFSLPTYEGDRP
ncbi:MAG: PAS domain S-box protein [Anaerolineae bacterium]